MMDIHQQISRSWKQYSIMHWNRRVASIHSSGTCTIYASSFLPYNLHLSSPFRADDQVGLKYHDR